jgi:hypothetical protein
LPGLPDSALALRGSSSGGLASKLPLRLRGHHLPDNQQGYSPEQPIAFSHRMHAGDLQISCLYCHSSADKGPHAGIPSASLCLNCHRFVQASTDTQLAAYNQAKKAGRPVGRVVSPELQKLYDALALDEKMQPEAGKARKPIAWIKVHNLPAFTRFDHRAHVQVGVDCEHCHGPVKTMERLSQVEDLSMGWCVNCHRDPARAIAERQTPAPTDCSTCHH